MICGSPICKKQQAPASNGCRGLLLYVYILRMTLHGLPAATVLAGMSLTTTLPAPMTQLSPMVTPGQTTTPVPNHTLLPTEMGLKI